MSRKKLVLLFLVIVSLIIFFILPTKIIFSDILLRYVDNFIYKNIKNGKTRLYADTIGECNRIGGKWEKLGGLRKEQCQIYSKDAGKSCFSGFQCELGVCEASIKSGPLTLGECRRILRRYGCSGQIHFGVSGMRLCID